MDHDYDRRKKLCLKVSELDTGQWDHTTCNEYCTWQ